MLITHDKYYIYLNSSSNDKKVQDYYIASENMNTDPTWWGEERRFGCYRNPIVKLIMPLSYIIILAQSLILSIDLRQWISNVSHKKVIITPAPFEFNSYLTNVLHSRIFTCIEFFR